MPTRRSIYKALALGVISMPVFLKSLMNDTKGQKTNTKGLSDEIFDWNMTTTWPPNFPVLGDACQLFADLLQKMSNGRMNISVYGGGEKVPALEAFSAVQSGSSIEMGSGASYYWSGKIPSSPFFASVPFGFNASQHTGWMLHGGGMELWREAYSAHNLVPFLGGNTGVQMGGWFNKEINALEDIEGLKMRIPGIGARVLERAGGAPVLLPGNEIYTGLERHIIDATEWLGPYHDMLMGFHEIAKYYYTPGWHEPGTGLEFFVNKDRFNELSPDLQAMFESASLHVHVWMWHEMEYRNAKALNDLKTHNIEIRNYPADVLKNLKEITADILREMVEEDEISKRVYDSINTFRKDAKSYSAITEKVFYNTLQ